MLLFRRKGVNLEKDEADLEYRARRTRPVPLIAVLLSVLMPGFGHGYCHRWFRGLFFFLFATGLTVLGIVSAWAGFAGMTFLSPVGTFFYVLCIFDAYRCSLNPPERISFQPSGKWSIVFFALAITVFLVTFSVVGAGTIAVKFIGHAVNVDTRSMTPTIRPGEKVLANRQLSRAFCFRQGDLVAVYIPGYKRQEEVRRVVALPGQSITMMGGRVEIDGKVLQENYATYQKDPFGYPPDNRAVYFKECLVPEKTLFLLSDVRDLGFDSREWGPVDESRIIGRVDFLFYPLERRRQFADSYLSSLTRKIMRFIPLGKERTGNRLAPEHP
jgi:signal peptidase I